MTEPINFEELLLESAILELKGFQNEKDVEEVLGLIAVIEETGIYLFLSNEMALSYTDFIANKLSCRRFILGLHERFLTKLLLKSPDITSGSEFVEKTIDQIVTTLSQMRANLQRSASLVIQDIQSNLKFNDLENVLINNQAMVVLYLAAATGVLSKAIATISND